MIHTGIDLVDISKIKKILSKNKASFLKRLCTEKEIEFLKNQKRNEDKAAEKVAAFWALKEAFSKTLGTGIGSSLSFHDLEVSYTKLGQPRVNYIGKHFKGAKDWQVACSVSHQESWLVAVVVIQGEVRFS
jgi:holo-[acyl-carrier protein] synthase